MLLCSKGRHVLHGQNFPAYLNVLEAIEPTEMVKGYFLSRSQPKETMDVKCAAVLKLEAVKICQKGCVRFWNFGSEEQGTSRSWHLCRSSSP